MDAIENKQVECSKKQKSLKEIYFQPAFLISVIILAIAGGGMTIAIDRLGIFLTKEPLALKKPLNKLCDGQQIGPYKVTDKKELDGNMIKALGTDDYIQWTLQDTQASENSPVRNCSFFVTYYGNADKIVTHVPDECYIGAGYDQQGADSLEFQIKDGDTTKKITTRSIVFNRKTEDGVSSGSFAVTYFFYADGVYVGSRTATRAVLNKNIFAKHSYYAKIEWSFTGNQQNPSKEELIAASQKLLGVVLPILEKEHWPDQEESGSPEH
jgi:hypothetical protein